MLIDALKKKPMLALYGGGIALLVAAAALWFFRLSIEPQRVFWGMVNQSLSTRAVTIEAQQTNGQNSVHQTVQYSLGTTNISHAYTTLTQNGTTVVDELIGTPTTDYTRYVRIQTPQKGPNGQSLNFSTILGVWATSGQSGQALMQGVLGTGLPIGGVAVPIANFPANVRSQLLSEIKDGVVYQVDYKSAKKQHVGGRLQYVYNVAVQPVAYAGLMKQFAQDLGVHALDKLDPATYRGQAALHLLLTVDARSHHLVTAELPNGGSRQTYTSYDIPVHVSVPGKTITAGELQQRLQHLQ